MIIKKDKETFSGVWILIFLERMSVRVRVRILLGASEITANLYCN